MMWLWFQMIGPNNWMLAPANVQTFEEGPNTFIIACCSLSTIDVLVLVLTELYQYSGISLQKKTSLLATSDNILYSLFGIARPPHMSWFCNKESVIPAVWCLLLPLFHHPFSIFQWCDICHVICLLVMELSDYSIQVPTARKSTLVVKRRHGKAQLQFALYIYVYIYIRIYILYILYMSYNVI